MASTSDTRLPAGYRERLRAEEERVRDAVLNRMDREDRHILIVGSAGYIGTVLTRHLLDRGYRVRGLDLLLFNQQLVVPPFLGHPAFEFAYGDLLDESRVAAALDGITDVVLLAGLVGDPITNKYPDAAARINDDGYDQMLRMLEGRGLNKVVFVSTCSNYGLIEGDHLADEQHALSPLSLYAKSKVRVERALLASKGRADFAPVVLRFATAFGLSPRMRFDLTVSEFTRSMYLGDDLLVYDAETWRPYCHVQDFAEVIRRVLEAPVEDVAFEVFNAGGDINNFTKQMIVDAILEELPGAVVRYKQHGSDPRNYRVSFAKIRERLHFEPSHTVQDGIRELIAALGQGLFHDIEQPRSFYGNHEIRYCAR